MSSSPLTAGAEAHAVGLMLDFACFNRMFRVQDAVMEELKERKLDVTPSTWLTCRVGAAKASRLLREASLSKFDEWFAVLRLVAGAVRTIARLNGADVWEDDKTDFALQQLRQLCVTLAAKAAIDDGRPWRDRFDKVFRVSASVFQVPPPNNDDDDSDDDDDDDEDNESPPTYETRRAKEYARGLSLEKASTLRAVEAVVEGAGTDKLLMKKGAFAGLRVLLLLKESRADRERQLTRLVLTIKVQVDAYLSTHLDKDLINPPWLATEARHRYKDVPRPALVPRARTFWNDQDDQDDDDQDLQKKRQKKRPRRRLDEDQDELLDQEDRALVLRASSPRHHDRKKHRGRSDFLDDNESGFTTTHEGQGDLDLFDDDDDLVGPTQVQRRVSSPMMRMKKKKKTFPARRGRWPLPKEEDDDSLADFSNEENDVRVEANGRRLVVGVAGNAVRKRVRWTELEVEALQAGVKTYGENWKAIRDRFHVLQKNRRTLDLRDKWRNLVKQRAAGRTGTGPPRPDASTAASSISTRHMPDVSATEGDARAQAQAPPQAAAPPPQAAPPPPQAAAPPGAAPPQGRPPLSPRDEDDGRSTARDDDGTSTSVDWVREASAKWLGQRLKPASGARVHMDTIRDVFLATYKDEIDPKTQAAIRNPRSRIAKLLRQAAEDIVGFQNVSTNVFFNGLNRVGIYNWRLVEPTNDDNATDDDDDDDDDDDGPNDDPNLRTPRSQHSSAPRQNQSPNQHQSTPPRSRPNQHQSTPPRSRPNQHQSTPPRSRQNQSPNQNQGTPPRSRRDQGDASPHPRTTHSRNSPSDAP